MVATDEVRRPVQTVWSTRRRLPCRRRDTIVWRPARSTPDRTYLVRFAVAGANGGRRVYGYEPPRRNRLTSGLVVRVQGIDAGFLARSYPVGGDGDRRHLDRRASACGCSSSRSRACPKPTVHDLRTGGVAVAPAVRLAWPTRGSTARYVQISAAGVAESGLYFLRVNCGGRTRRLRAADPAAAHARRAQGRGRALDEHLAGVQLPRRERRRLGRQLVRRRREPDGRPAASVPRLRRPLPLPATGT